LLRLSHQDKNKFADFSPDRKFKDSYLKKDVAKKSQSLDKNDTNGDIEVEPEKQDEVNISDHNSRKENENE
jgi:hypothetical protein